MSAFDRVSTTYYSTLTETMEITVYRSRASYLSKVAYFNLAHVHLSASVGDDPFNCCHDFLCQKTRVPGLSCSVVSMILVYI